jgi:hypothetical protein
MFLSSCSLFCPLILHFLPLLFLLVFLVDQRDEHVTEHRKDGEISAANAITGFRHFRPVLMIQILANPVLPPYAPLPTSEFEADEISVVMVSQGTLGKGQRIQTRTTSRPTISLSLWLLLLFSSSVHGITLNCINKNTPSSSCCSGEITLDPTMTSIAVNAFNGCSGLNGSLIIPSSVTTIGASAFYFCGGLTALTLPSSVTTIGTSAFNGCSGLTGFLTLPSSVTTIGVWAFNGCSGFTGSLTLPSSLTTIADYAFRLCSGFTGSLTIPSSVTTIGRYAFAYCSRFTGSLTLPSSVTAIGNSAFDGCSGFTSAVTFPNSVATLGTTPFASNKCNWLSCCSSCTLTGAQICFCASPSCSGVCAASFPSFAPSTSPILFGFYVKFGDNGILGSGKAILVDYLRDAKRGDLPLLPPFSLLTLPPCLSASSVSGKMFPISHIINSTEFSSTFDPPLSSASILIKWRPVSAVSGIGSWESDSSHTILSIPRGGVLVSWLVSLLSEEIKGFIIKGE